MHYYNRMAIFYNVCVCGVFVIIIIGNQLRRNQLKQLIKNF